MASLWGGLLPLTLLSCWVQVMLWLLLTLVEYVFSEEDSKEPDPQHALSPPPWAPEHSNTHTAWRSTLGKSVCQ